MSCSITLCFIPLRQGLSVNLKLVLQPPSPSEMLLPTPYLLNTDTAGVIDMQRCPASYVDFGI